MQWHEIIIACHVAVTDQVSHGGRMKSDRYFVWQEDGTNDLEADGVHGERAVTGTTDLYTRTEFDTWARQLERAMDAEPDVAWEKLGVQYEPDTGFWHHEWAWEVLA